MTEASTKTQVIKIRDLMSSRIIFCEEDESIPNIAQKLMNYWLDTIFCLDKENHRVIGIITDGIIWKLIANADPKIYQYKAKDIMYKKIITIEAEKPFNSLEEIKDVIDGSPVKRVAVLDKDGKIIGLVRRKFIERVKRYSRHFNVEFSK